jgi:predicted metal-dependent hydrolase
MKPRPPQLALRLDFEPPDASARWRDGARLAYLGKDIVLTLDTRRSAAALEDGVLHLPLPPEATPRQIQDGAEAWLRHEAQRVLTLCIGMQARARGRAIPRCSLSFAARGHWVQPDGRGGLRCHWRLIEQPVELMEQTLGLAIAKLPASAETPDLFACAA